VLQVTISKFKALILEDLELLITVEQLRILANTPLDLAEEEKRDQVKENIQ
jgi:hypothetical protein